MTLENTYTRVSSTENARYAGKTVKYTMLIQSAWEMTGGGWMILDTGKSVCAGRTTRSHINEECRASRKCITSTESLWMIARKGNHRVQHGTVNRVSQYGSKFYTSQKGGWLEPPERGRNASSWSFPESSGSMATRSPAGPRNTAGTPGTHPML